VTIDGTTQQALQHCKGVMFTVSGLCASSLQVLEWSPLPDGGVAVTTDYKTYHADKLVISSGAWMEQMVPELKV
jgi:hypothetical protein